MYYPHSNFGPLDLNQIFHPGALLSSTFSLLHPITLFFLRPRPKEDPRAPLAHLPACSPPPISSDSLPFPAARAAAAAPHSYANPLSELPPHQPNPSSTTPVHNIPVDLPLCPATTSTTELTFLPSMVQILNPEIPKSTNPNLPVMKEKEASLDGVGEEGVTWKIHFSITTSPQMASTETRIARVPLSSLSLHIDW